MKFSAPPQKQADLHKLALLMDQNFLIRQLTLGTVRTLASLKDLILLKDLVLGLPLLRKKVVV